MKKLLVLTAVPGSGKSTWARKYKETHGNVYIVSSDEIRYELTNSYLDFSHQKDVWELFSQRIHEYSKLNDDVTVILDALCDLNRLRIQYVMENPEFDYYELVMIKKDRKSAEEYNKQRGEEHWVPDEVLQKLFDKFEEPNDEVKKVFNKVTVIDYYF